MSDCICTPNPGIDPRCPVHGDNAQPLPIPNDLPIAHVEVMKDLQSRLDIGIQRYGQPLRPFNGRKQLRDAYEEALDMCVYLWSALYEEEHPMST